MCLCQRVRNLPSTNMAPKPKPSTESLKQKSLTSFFTKGAPTASASKSTTVASTSRPNGKDKPSTTNEQKDKTKISQAQQASTIQSENESASSPREPKTPDVRHANHSFAGASSAASSRVASSPPTSEAIDVDMIPSDEDIDKSQPSSAVSTRHKRKVVMDSDEEMSPGEDSKGRRKPLARGSSPTDAIKSRSKRPRLSTVILDDDEDDDATEENNIKQSFTQKLNRFKKSPVKKGKARSRASSDDDDFVVPDDSDDDDTRSIKSLKSTSSRRSSTSSRYSRTSNEDDEELDDSDLDDDKPKKKITKPKAKAAPEKGANAAKASKSLGTSADGAGTGSFTFLTAAEQREQDKKDDKKASESPYDFLLDVRDKDGRKPGTEDYDPRTLYIPKKAWASFTPFEKQFWETKIKQNHYDTVDSVLSKRLYEDDARIGHQEFDLKLTNRVKMCMVGVPEMSFNLWASKFLAKGYKVGRVEQAETALGAEMRMAAEKGQNKGKGKGAAGTQDKIVRRELNKVYTTGTLVDQEFLTDDQAGHCISICEATTCREDGTELDSERRFGVCVLDCSTSQFNLSHFDDDVCRTQMETLMRQVCPKEILYKKGTLSKHTISLLKNVLPSGCLWTALRPVEGFNYEETLTELKTIYPAELNEDVEMEDEDSSDNLLPRSVPSPIREMAHDRLAIEALGSMIWYLRQLNIDKDILSMKNFNIYDPMKKGMGLTLDGQTLAHLEVLVNNEGTDQGSLLKLLGRCITPFGKRLFRIWLCMPLRDVSDINTRLDAVQDILDHPTFEATFAEVAKGLPDLERIVSRIHAKSCRVRDFLKVLKAFDRLNKGIAKLADESESFKSKTVLGLLRGAPDILPHIRNIQSMFKPTEDEKVDELIPRDGKDEKYDEVVAEINALEASLDADLKKFKKSLGIDLEYWHSAIGNKDIYLVEVSTKVDKKKFPSDWTKTGGTKAC
ncbi:hypothetical protein D9613_010131 [Agrocybe pediades]|uniref:DNA mismatch repair protein MutS core domain-containing protein n=1 Tax=Agrocybe pediades TaxID=84607 RepID=A0A8H4QZ54_9AGAR|nr:hypothetical protein D9613_010131 [Agrocybe pediades]